VNSFATVVEEPPMSEIFPNHEIWSSMFGLDHLSVVEKILRPLLIYAFLVIGLRLAGKRELAQMNPLDLIVLLTLSNTVQNAIIGNDNSVTGGVIGAITLLSANFWLNRFSYEHPKVDRLLSGEPVPLISNGVVQEQNLHRETISVEELAAVVRKQGLRGLDDVEIAMLETSGTISILERTPTAEQRAFARLQAQLDRIEEMLKAGAR
jgi:uncharacterized membrane protein YcaP (DUF421 family)